MSGTSGDGIDAAAVRVGGARSVELLSHVHVAFDPAFRARVLAAGSARAPELACLHIELGRHFAQAACRAMDAAGLAPDQVAAVASPGLTAVHRPPEPGDEGATLALGDGDVIAEGTGCTVVSDFRARDRAAGGQGAPLVPWADAVLLRRPGTVRAALNLGGIANLTVVPPQGPPLAFDTGPGNMVLDGALARRTAGEVGYDDGGALGLAGAVDEAWLALLLAADEFVTRPPPKSTGRERYGEAFLDAHAATIAALEPEDLAATLAAYTVVCVERGLADHVRDRPVDLVVSGGGALNRCLMQGLAAALAPIEVTDSLAALGIPVLAKEAVAFALLGDAALRGVPAGLPSVTGARRACVLGKISPASAGC